MRKKPSGLKIEASEIRLTADRPSDRRTEKPLNAYSANTEVSDRHSGWHENWKCSSGTGGQRTRANPTTDRTNWDSERLARDKPAGRVSLQI